MRLWSLIYAWPSQRRSVCMCLLNGNIALSGARWNYGLSGSCTLFLWGISWYGLAALLAQGTGRRSSGGWNPVKGKTNGKLRGLSPWQKFKLYPKYLIFREEGRDFFRIFVFCSWHLPSHCIIESRDEWGWRVGMAETGWIKSGVKKCTTFVSKKQELNTGSSLSFWEVNIETKGKNQERVKQKAKNKCTLFMRYITAGPPRLKMSGSHFSYSFFSLLLFSVSVLCFVLFFYLCFV